MFEIFLYMYLIPTILSFLSIVITDKIDKTNNFDVLVLSIVPVFNISIPLLLISQYINFSSFFKKIHRFLYDKYSAVIGVSNEEYEWKHFRICNQPESEIENIYVERD